MIAAIVPDELDLAAAAALPIAAITAPQGLRDHGKVHRGIILDVAESPT